jgi:2-C-methyl-D-erythritol 2,4-cyclodiphosphate synthase
VYRIGSGHDSHRLVSNRPLILGGVRVEFPLGLDGHSDADVVMHAVTDAMLGAAGLGDIGDAFPDTEHRWKDQVSDFFLTESLYRLTALGWRPVNLDVTIFAQQPKLGPIKPMIRENLARILSLHSDAVNVKAKTGEHVGHIGRGEAIACHAIMLMERINAKSSPVVAKAMAIHPQKQSV